jgi:hypothetical protein
MSRERLYYPQNPHYEPHDPRMRPDILDPRQMQQMPGVGGLHEQEDLEEQHQDTHTGAIPSLMDLLWMAYGRHLKLKLDERRASGQKAVSLEEALRRAPASHFFDFCCDYLSRHRPVQQFPSDANMGFMLSNNRRALLCPPVEGGYSGAGGQMQDAQAVGVTQGRSQPGMGGVFNDGGIPII